jgi:hypothetical protein
MRLHGLDRRPTSHQHNVNQRFPQERFAEKYPDIYPIIDGRRYLPTPGDQRWQPCFSEPTLVDAAVESARDFFAAHPEMPYIAFTVQDSHAHCERDLASDEVQRQIAALGPEQGRTQGLSNLYWAFLNRVAERLETTYPDRRVVGLVYAQVRRPPPFRLHKNIVAWMVFKMSDIVIDRRFAENADYFHSWADRAAAIGHHDWSCGYGYL